MSSSTSSGDFYVESECTLAILRIGRHKVFPMENLYVAVTT